MLLHRHRPSLIRIIILQHQLPGLLLLLLLSVLLPAVLGQSETALPDPQYYNIAPCPCDLQASICDVGCCCDTACTDNDKTLFDCDQGLYGGNVSALELYRRCNSTDNSNPDYHPFTCVLIENYNAYLGRYFAVQAIATDWQSKRNSGTAATLAGQFPVQTILGLQESSLATAQRAGLLLLEIPGGVTPTWLDSRQVANNRLALPSRSLSGGCDRSAGIAYLLDSSDACEVTMSAAVCSADVASPIDANIFAIACAGGNATCTVSVLTRAATAQAVPVSVTYQTLSSAVGYQKGLAGSSPTVAAGSLASPSPTGTDCSNAVVDVQYRFVWSGSSLISLTATVSMATVALDSTVTQKFGVAFVHQSAASLATVAKRSGLVGYDIGAQLLGGVRGTSGPVNASSGYWPTLWRAGSDGACPASGSAAGGEPVLFQVEAASYCTEAVSNFTDCASLRQQLRTRLREQFPAGVIGVFGSANVSTANDWVTLLEQNLTDYTGLDFAINNSSAAPAWTEMPGLCLGLPTEIVLTVLYAEQGKANDSSIWQVVGAYLRYKQVHVAATCGPTGCSSTSLLLSTEVQFVRVPPDWADNDAAYLGPYKSHCWWGICWDELTFPVSADFEGDSRAASIAWIVLIVLVAVYAFCISRPWW